MNREGFVKHRSPLHDTLSTRPAEACDERCRGVVCLNRPIAGHVCQYCSGVTLHTQRPADWMPGAAACIQMIQQPVSQRAVSGI